VQNFGLPTRISTYFKLKIIQAQYLFINRLLLVWFNFQLLPAKLFYTLYKISYTLYANFQSGHSLSFLIFRGWTHVFIIIVVVYLVVIISNVHFIVIALRAIGIIRILDFLLARAARIRTTILENKVPIISSCSSRVGYNGMKSLNLFENRNNQQQQSAYWE
jgi:hypothetical protein